ncbi:MAG: tetratricopeptide repeat protein [Verrucomicrobiales bacterium]|nr:tetratricopeptide repeat protein [Verrucomicrobiales bacterium]
MLLCVFALSFTSPAAAKPAKEETQALTFAEKAFQDGIYDVAALHLAKFLKDFPNSELTAEAKIYLAQCHLLQGQPKLALPLTMTPPANTPDALKPEFIFWHAETAFALKDWAQAVTLYREGLRQYPDAPSAVRSRLNLSVALLQTEGETAALTALDPLLVAKNPADRQQALLQKARVLISGNKLDEATLIVDQMAREKLDRKAQYQLYYWTAELARLADQPAKAVEHYQKITGDPRAFPNALVARAWFGLGLIHKTQAKWSAAAEAFQQAYATASDPDVTQAAVLEYLNAQSKNNTLTQGALAIRKVARERGATGLSGLYAIGLFYYNTGNYDAAITELDSLNAGQPNSEWSGPAQLLIADCFLKKNDLAAAAKIFGQVRAQLPNTPLALDAAYRLAEIQAQRGSPTEALADFLAVARQSANPKQAEDAYFQALTLMARDGKTDEFAAIQTEFAAKFPTSPRLADLAMEQARLQEAAGRDADAQKIYQTLTQGKDNQAAAAEATFRLALLQFQSGQTDEALQNLQTLEQAFPNYDNLAEAVYLRLLLQKARLKPDDFRAELAKLADRFPKNDDLVAKTLFQAADSHFNQGDHAKAQTGFLQVAEQFPAGAYAEIALYKAGQCAMTLGNYSEAVAILEKIPDASPIKADARIVQVRCYNLAGKWQNAIRIADSVIANRLPDPIWADASLRKANCLYRLAKGDTRQYDAALTVVNQVLAAKKDITLSQHNEAGCLKGDILAQQQRPTEALAAYLEVIYGRLLPSERTGLPAEPEHYWFSRAGVSAAKLLEDKGDIKGEIQVYRILERLSEPFRDEFHKKIDELKARHFIYEE